MSNFIDNEVTVIGGGMVGCAIASLLARCGISVSLVEGRIPTPFDAGNDIGLRVSAISPGSQAILRQAGAWRTISANRHCPYARMEIEDHNGGASLTFDAPAFGLANLGAIIENDLVQWALWQAVQSNALVELHCPDHLVSLENGPSDTVAELSSGLQIRSGLLIGADGANSAVRKLAGVSQDVWEYNQQGLVCVVSKEMPNPGIAWQRFMPGGPLAFLPLADGRSSIVWTRAADEAARMLALPDQAFMSELGAASEGWLGTVQTTGPRAAFPLAMRLSDRHVSGRIILLGDAAHVVHPLAGQGVNLGFADAAALVETLVASRAAGRDLAAPDSLRAYERWRKSESGMMSMGIHGLGSLFGIEALAGVRRLGMGFVSGNWFLREEFVRRAAGLNHNAPHLSRGGDLKSLLGQTAA